MSGIFTKTIGYVRPYRSAPTVGTHGMVVFGTGTDCYFSHRPMFFSPYDFQVLLDIELDERGKRALGADRRAGFGGIHAFDPADLSLAELDPCAPRPRTTFRGNLIRGHLERGGIVIARDVVATVRTVMSFAQLDPHPLRDGELLTHLCFGRSGKMYLAHRIARRPSFDQIVAARLIPGTVTDLLGVALPHDVTELEFDRAQPIILGQREFTGQRLRVGEIALAAVHTTASAGGEHGFLVEVAVERQIYLEVADLA
ncbi:hypothetical protein OG874_12680 [Nocardia sp. NBC_00565]|uniref:hypothetical protein n=1 Tax=Nocardia sp. NBC_00565 TaxID=2975993 RepID=UPI002E800C4C|nr:hypothetical protein [Nocardia sp. NBC_00565]WUC05934.1 hypothetical protein OG874_12680 [Nocardia sp. NBC_00565]